MPDERQELITTLNALVPEQLEEIIFTLKPPGGVIPPSSASQGQRVSRLLEWTESPTGCGLERVQDVLRTITGKPPLGEPLKKPLNIKKVFEDLCRKTIFGKHNRVTVVLIFMFCVSPILLGVLSLLGISLPITPKITPACELKPEDKLLSCGEKPITSGEESVTGTNKQEGIRAYASQHYDDAVSFLEDAWNKTKDAETLIYLNNAKLYSTGVKKDKIFTIAVVIPHDTSEDILNTKYLSKNILEGVAKEQKEFNEHSTNWKLQILIANDGNDPEQGKQVANQLVKRDIIAVMGHYSSRVTMSVKSIYEEHKIVLLSASSASSDLSNRGEDTFFFRVINTTEYQSEQLAEYLKNKGYKKLALFAVHRRKVKSNGRQEKFGVSDAFHLDFTEQWLSFGSEYQIVYDADLDPAPDTNIKDEKVAEQLKKANQKQAEAIVLCPDVKEPIILRAKELIDLNEGKLLISGCSTLNHKYYSENINPLYYHKLIIAAWQDDEKFIKDYEGFWLSKHSEEYSKKYDVSRYALAYDAIKVLIDAINQLKKERIKPSSSELQKILTEPTFTTQGLTGKISFRGSERAEKTIKIVKQNCPKPDSNDGCKWMNDE